uniref:Endoplasmic reticulum junction formation protein lunapark n=1 Tax=Romanomermis culicivorax TaxID=13658 RepID=A0A915J8B5_ROMCU
MGNIIFRKPLTTLERLEKLEESILNAEEYRKTTQLSQKRYVAYLIIFSSLVYLLAFVVGYFYYYPLTALDMFLRLIPLILFPFLIIGLKILGCWWFVLRLESNDQFLERTKRKRRDILDQQRNAKLLADSFGEKSSDDSMNMTQMKSPEKRLPRPIMPHNRSVFDKLIDYFLVDGPENRYALICKFCFGHNGMALLEDFKNLSYKCAYCHAFNGCAAKADTQNGDDEKIGTKSPKQRSELSPCADNANKSTKNSPVLNGVDKKSTNSLRTKVD